MYAGEMDYLHGPFTESAKFITSQNRNKQQEAHGPHCLIDQQKT